LIKYLLPENDKKATITKKMDICKASSDVLKPDCQRLLKLQLERNLRIIKIKIKIK
jgi:hypothetical protein